MVSIGAYWWFCNSSLKEKESDQSDRSDQSDQSDRSDGAGRAAFNALVESFVHTISFSATKISGS